MGEGVETVDAGRDPGDEEGAEEEEGDARVEPGFRVGFAEGRVAGEAADVEKIGDGGLPLVLLVLLADFHVDGVGVEAAGFDGFGAGDCH